MGQGNIRGSVQAVEFLLVEVKSSQLVSHNGHPGWYNHGAGKSCAAENKGPD